MDQVDDVASCRGLYDKVLKILAVGDVNTLPSQDIIGALEHIKNQGDLDPSVASSLQSLVSKVKQASQFPRSLFS